MVSIDHDQCFFGSWEGLVKSFCVTRIHQRIVSPSYENHYLVRVHFSHSLNCAELAYIDISALLDIALGAAPEQWEYAAHKAFWHLLYVMLHLVLPKVFERVKW